MRKFVVFVSGLLVCFSVLAKTPDGLTPAEETVCDPLKSGARGLYGLCVSYCEARDVGHEVAMGNVKPQRAAKLAARQEATLDRYNAMRKPSDPAMPCLQQNTCPCWSGEQTSALFWSTKSVAKVCQRRDSATMKLSELFTPVDQLHPEYTAIRAFGFGNTDTRVNYCVHIDADSGTSMFTEVGESEFIMCATEVDATCEVLGL